MKLTLEQVDHVANLARIALSDEERNELAVQLSSILTHIDTLRVVDTSTIAPTAGTVGASNVTRPDNIIPSWPADALLANAPDRQGDQFRVDAVLEQ
jgi:aspartyl-tRNA(Asn)/glutamyl-tRNA(Gln) amidotransferase subunit C